MSIWNTDEEIYQQGLEDAQNASIFDEFAHSLGEGLPLPSTRDDEIYEKGWQDGMKSK